jgi:hypothetical protein
MRSFLLSGLAVRLDLSQHHRSYNDDSHSSGHLKQAFLGRSATGDAWALAHTELKTSRSSSLPGTKSGGLDNRAVIRLKLRYSDERTKAPEVTLRSLELGDWRRQPEFPAGAETFTPGYVNSSGATSRSWENEGLGARAV